MQRHPSAHQRPQLLSISEHRNPSRTSIKNTNPLTVALALFLSPSVMARSVLTYPLLPVCLSLSFFLPPQIHIDIPRTNPLIPLFQQASVQEVRPLQEHTRHLTLGGFSLLLPDRLTKASFPLKGKVARCGPVHHQLESY